MIDVSRSANVALSFRAPLLIKCPDVHFWETKGYKCTLRCGPNVFGNLGQVGIFAHVGTCATVVSLWRKNLYLHNSTRRKFENMPDVPCEEFQVADMKARRSGWGLFTFSQPCLQSAFSASPFSIIRRRFHTDSGLSSFHTMSTFSIHLPLPYLDKLLLV